MARKVGQIVGRGRRTWLGGVRKWGPQLLPASLDH